MKRRRIYIDWGARTVTNAVGEGLGVYPFVQQHGAVIPMKGKGSAQNRFFRFMLRRTGHRMWLALMLKKTPIVIWPRPFVMMQGSDFDYIMGLLVNNTIKFKPAAPGGVDESGSRPWST